MLRNGKILLVEDDDDSRAMLEIVLQNKGFDVIACANGEAALASLEQSKPNVVLLDIMMPGMSGYDVLVRMRQRPETQNIPVIMVTAKGDGADIITGYQFGADYYIPKPFTTEQLLYGIELFLNR